MNVGMLHFALRELTRILASRNLWLAFAAIVILFAVTGPFGTLEALRFIPRTFYWLTVHGSTWSIALAFAVLADMLLAPYMANMFWRMMIGSVLAAIPIGAVTELLEYAWFGHPFMAGNLPGSIALALPLCVIFCVISYLAMSGEAGIKDAQPENSVSSPAPEQALPQSPPILDRLKPENRGRLQHLAVEDHYTLVHTSRGRQLLLLRFSDALKETGDQSGLQVHRSHWVADDFVAGLNRTEGKLTLRLNDDSEIPVSRTYAAKVRARFG